MKKEFDTWNEKKKKVNNDHGRPFFHEGEIWFCYIGENIGFEQDGRGEDFLRPVLVFKKFNNNIFWGIPLSKSRNNINKKNSKFYYQFKFIEGIQSVAILSQIRLIDAKRLARKIGDISKNDFELVIKKLKELMP